MSEALDRLGVAEDDAEFEVLEEPKTGLFGRVRGEARVRARIRPTAVRPKQDRRNRGRGKAREQGAIEADGGEATSAERTAPSRVGAGGNRGGGRSRDDRRPRDDNGAPARGDDDGAHAAPDRDDRNRRPKPQRKEQPMSGDAGSDADGGAEIPPEAVGQAAIEFMTGLATAFGTTATAELHVDGSEIDVQVSGSDLGLLIGPGGRTLMAVQDLARVASQRRLGDHDTRLRIDVAGYRERRREALEKFATAVAHEVTESGTRQGARADGVGRSQGHPRRDPGDRRRDEPLRRRRASPSGRHHPGLITRRAVSGPTMHDELTETLRTAQRLGFFGAAPIEVGDRARAGRTSPRSDHSTPGSRLADLGSGGGLPGLVLAAAYRDVDVVLIDRRQKRTDFLERAVHPTRLDQHDGLVSRCCPRWRGWSSVAKLAPFDVGDRARVRSAGGDAHTRSPAARHTAGRADTGRPDASSRVGS